MASKAPESETSSDELTIEDLVRSLGNEKRGERDGQMVAPSIAANGSPVSLVEDLPMDAADDLRDIDGEASPRLMSIIESLLFAAEKPLTVKQIRKLLREPSQRQVQLALKQLLNDTHHRGVMLAQVAGGFLLRTNPKNARWVQKFLQSRPVRLSRAQLETLSIVAYRQPVTRAEIEHVRGVDSGAVLGGLLERELIRIVGRKEEPGRPMLYGTTVGFLELFSLMSLKDLPDLQEFKELSDETKEGLRRKMGDDEVEALGQEVMEFVESGGEPPEDAEERSAEGEAGATEAGDGAESASKADEPKDVGEPEPQDAGEPASDDAD
jgi:segregation and condensation protein B